MNLYIRAGALSDHRESRKRDRFIAHVDSETHNAAIANLLNMVDSQKKHE